MDEKKIILSGIQPSGVLTLGNYVGAVKNWLALQDEYNCYFMIVDMHAITLRQNPTELRKRCMDFLALYLAMGLDPDKSTLFFQSHVPQHAELSWVLTCHTYMGELSRMTQFKDKSKSKRDADGGEGSNVGAGLFVYPVLMAADILLYQADLVPVGQDQKQHLEITRDIAERFNKIYGDVLTVPKPFIPEVGARIMSLADPFKKMSKSDDNPNAGISVIDDKDTILRKFKRAVTDSESVVRRGEGKEGIENLLNIYCAVTGKSAEEAEGEFAGAGYGVFKQAVGETVADALAPVREKYLELTSDKEYLRSVYEAGAEKASRVAAKTLNKVYRRIGFVDRGRKNV